MQGMQRILRLQRESSEEIQRSRVEGNARSRNNPDSTLPMLQEARIQAYGIGPGQDKSYNKEVNRLHLPSVITAPL